MVLDARRIQLVDNLLRRPLLLQGQLRVLVELDVQLLPIRSRILKIRKDLLQFSDTPLTPFRFTLVSCIGLNVTLFRVAKH